MDWRQAAEAYCEEAGCTCLKEEAMGKHTTFRIGGPAERILLPKDCNQAAGLLRLLNRAGQRAIVIGKGSDLLVSDAGLRGPVLKLDEEGAKPNLIAETKIRCPAGASLATLCAFALKNSLTGLEFAWGIPGSVGGAVYMNAGAYGGEMKDVLSRVEYLDWGGERHETIGKDLQMGYRKSWFTSHPGNLITNTLFSLSKGNPEEIRARMEEYMDARREKQPLDYPSAGSTFKRPLGGYAAELIDQCGLRGRQIGGAMVSRKHAGFIINYEEATCRDVLTLVEEVRQVVKTQTGFTLECEIQYLERK